MSTEFPFLATSTDGLISDPSVPGKGFLEIKYPVSQMHNTDLAATRKNFCLKRGVDGTLSLRKSHSYYTQIQCDMASSRVTWRDFVVFTVLDDDGKDREEVSHDIFVERVLFSDRLCCHHCRSSLCS